MKAPLLFDPGTRWQYEVDTAAKFVAALRRDFRQNWLLMSRSESLQTGTAATPRVLLPSNDARYVFTFALATHTS